MRLSDGTDREFTPEEAEMNLAIANAVGIERGNLKMQNEWLREQLLRPWRIENYRGHAKAEPGTRRAIGAAA